MKEAAVKTAGKAASERLTGDGPGAMRALVVSAIAGAATAVLTYRLLRSGNGEG